MTNPDAYHVPVLLKPCLDGLAIKPDGIYVDLTFGGGGHSKAILEQLTTGRLLSFDQDPDAAANAKGIDNRSFTFIDANFRYLRRYLRLHGVSQVDGILGDLGVSSHQFDEGTRGFTFREDVALDMRMNPSAELTAAGVLNHYPVEELHRLFGMYGEVKNARSLAQSVDHHRGLGPLESTGQLLEVLRKHAPRGREHKYFAQVFQALRIEVNGELEALKEVLEQSVQVLKEGGRLVVMSYHSLEDRLVKNFIQKGRFHGEQEKDLYGNVLRPFDQITRKPIIPGPEEVEQNSRARSAKLRIAERNNWQNEH